MTNAATSKIDLAIDGKVAIVTLSDIATRHALASDMVKQLVEVLDKLACDQAIHCIVLTGQDPAFCAGGNIKDMCAGKDMFEGGALALNQQYQQGIQQIPLAFERLSIPIIAAVNGAAYGAGCDLAAMCDLRIASSKAVFAESFVRLGIISGDGGAWFLPRLIGYAKAAEMTFTGKAIDAQQALEWGLVNEVCEHDLLAQKALELANQIACHGREALEHSKKLLKASERSSLQDTLTMSAAFQALMHQSAEHQEAMSELAN